MGIVAGMSVAWEAKAGTVAGSVIAGGGILSGKLLAWLAALCVLSVLIAVPLRNLLSARGPEPATETETHLPDTAPNHPSEPGPETSAPVAGANNGVPVSAIASGRVVDEQTGEGINRALVTILAEDGGTAGEGKTDGAGQFRIAGLPDGAFRIDVSGDYIVPQSEPVAFDIVNGTDARGVAVPVRVGGVVEGRVNDAESGNGTPDVRVAATAESAAPAVERLSRTEPRLVVIGSPASLWVARGWSAATWRDTPRAGPGIRRNFKPFWSKRVRPFRM